MIMIIGPSRDGRRWNWACSGLDSEDAVIIHAMPAGSDLGGSVSPVRLTTVTNVKDQNHESAVVNLV